MPTKVPPQKKRTPITSAIGAIIGVAADATYGLPLTYAKVGRQLSFFTRLTNGMANTSKSQPQPRSSFSTIAKATASAYRLLPQHFACMGSATVMQFSINQALLSKKENNSTANRIFASATGGAVGALAATPIENAMVTLKNNPHFSVYTCFKTMISQGALYNSLAPRIARDVPYAVAMLYGSHAFAEYCCERWPYPLVKPLALATAGFTTALATQPIDVLGNYVSHSLHDQKNIARYTIKAYHQAATSLYHHGGIPAFWVGLGPRSGAIIGSVIMLPTVVNHVEKQLLGRN